MKNALTAFIAENWFVTREAMNAPDTTISLFMFSAEELGSLIKDLKGSVMEGIFEYKKTRIRSILRPLESLQYDSRAMGHLQKNIKEAKALLMVTMIQRLFCVNKVKLSTVRAAEKTTPLSFSEASLKEILEFVQEEIRGNPEKMKDSAIKKILMYSKMYQNEIKKMKDLAATIPADKKQPFMENFKRSLNDITAKINASYSLLREGAPGAGTREETAHHLARFNYAPLAPLLETQCRSFSQVLSTLLFAEKEKFRTRELLVELASSQAFLLKEIEKEQKKYEEIDPFDKNGLKAGREFVSEISKYLRKEQEWVKHHPW